MPEEGINVYPLLATLVIIGVALFLVLFPFNDVPSANTSLASVAACLLCP